MAVDVDLGERLGLDIPAGVLERLAAPISTALSERVFRLNDNRHGQTAHAAFGAMRLLSHQRPPRNLLPIAAVDARSYACVVCSEADGEIMADTGAIVRWHLDDVPTRTQRQLLDTDVGSYLDTVAREEEVRERGLELMIEIANEFHETHGSDGRRPRAHEWRPLHVASQNVIVGQGAFRYDAGFDGLAVKAWQTCQVPHLAAHEGNRALAALTVGEAFRGGGTMEIRFDAHPEAAVPASLRQFARTRGISLGADDACALSPTETRALMAAVAQFPAELTARIRTLTEVGAQSLERAYYVVLAGIWQPIELDFLLATSPRALSVLRGGADPLVQRARQAELAVCRAAIMCGTALARLSVPRDDSEVSVRVHEDEHTAVTWTVYPDEAAIRFDGIGALSLPWQQGTDIVLGEGQPLLVVPRARVSERDRALAAELAASQEAVAATLEPADSDGKCTSGVARMVCPDGVTALDRTIERRLTAARVGRA